VSVENHTVHCIAVPQCKRQIYGHSTQNSIVLHHHSPDLSLTESEQRVNNY